MERKPNIYFSLFLIIEHDKASSPVSLSNKRKFTIILSDKEVIIYKAEEGNISFTPQFSRLNFNKNEADKEVSSLFHKFYIIYLLLD